MLTRHDSLIKRRGNSQKKRLRLNLSYLVEEGRDEVEANAVLKVLPAETGAHTEQVRTLFWEYLQWANDRVNQEFGITFDIASMLEHDMADLAKFLLPHGRLLLAVYGNEPAGIACMRKLSENTGEVKRMYVRPAFRGRGVGHALMDALLAEAREMGYQRLRLDSARFMHAAHRLYRSVGFEEIEAYEGSEVPQEFQVNWIFMEKALV